tara:strand:- start:3392 stop:3820 length:429 start_codon:yes stop_codon:yes gene_type:complete
MKNMSLTQAARTGTMKSGVSSATKAGLCLHADGTNTLEVCAQGDVVLAITADEQERDASGLVAGGNVSYHTLGGVLMLRSKASQTYTVGLAVYADTAGLVTDSDDKSGTGSKQVGIFVGATGITTGTTEDLIPVDTSFAAKA